MKTKLFYLVLFFCTINCFAQTNGIYFHSKARAISTITADDVNNDELHLATDIGYIKYNTSSNTVTDRLNLTSQIPAIGNIRGISTDPTSNDIALALNDGIAIYDGTSVSKYTYNNSGLTVGENTSEFLFLQVQYASDGSLYVFKEDDFGYQKYDNNAFETQIITSFKPQAILENSAGTKAYFAGSNNGIWELEKSTNMYTNYTTANSNIGSNFITSMAITNNEDLYIGHYQGLSKLTLDGAITSCNATSPIPVFEVSISPTNGNILARTSLPNSASVYGLNIVDYDNCTWTSYTNDNTNCLNSDVFANGVYGGNGRVYASTPTYVNNGELKEFTPSTDTCTTLDTNYLNAPDINWQYTTNFGVRTKANGNLEIAVAEGSNAKMFSIDPMNPLANFSAPMTLDSNGELFYEVMGYNNYFIIDNGSGVVLLDETNTAVINNYGLPNATVYKTMIAPEIDEAANTFFLLVKAFQDNVFKAFKTICNTDTNSCEPVEEVLTNDRTFEENFEMAIRDYLPYDHAILSIVKANAQGERSYAIVESNTTQTIYYDDVINQSAEVENKQPLVGSDTEHVYGMYQNSIFEITLLTINSIIIGGEPTTTTLFWDIDNDGESDVILGAKPWETFDNTQNFINVFMLLGSDALNAVVVKPDTSADRNATDYILSDLNIQSPPSDFRINDFKLMKNDNNSSTAIILTNYGFLVNTNVNTSAITLSTNENIPSENKAHIYPNPSKDMVTLSNNTIKSVSVYDLNGRLVLNKKSNTFSIAHIAKGIYTLRAYLNDGSELISKLIKN